MKAPSGAATQICAHRFDRRFFALPSNIQQQIQEKIDELGRSLRTFSHLSNAGSGRLPFACG